MVPGDDADKGANALGASFGGWATTLTAATTTENEKLLCGAKKCPTWLFLHPALAFQQHLAGKWLHGVKACPTCLLLQPALHHCKGWSVPPVGGTNCPLQWCEATEASKGQSIQQSEDPGTPCRQAEPLTGSDLAVVTPRSRCCFQDGVTSPQLLPGGGKPTGGLSLKEGTPMTASD